ncbi:MAG: hypothetical protein HFI50_17565 [Lachnospiraceae bacterium]|jgi:hypothetical protein|nr:hypothetical protein [Lachnospiraceae bacterium]
MKKRNIIIGITVIIVAVISIYLITRPKVLGNMSNSYSGQTTTSSDISFSVEAGEKIRFSFRSNIVSGDLDMVLYDSAGNEVYILDKAKALETFFTLNRSDTYTLVAECNSFIGEYKISVYKVD